MLSFIGVVFGSFPSRLRPGLYGCLMAGRVRGGQLKTSFPVLWQIVHNCAVCTMCTVATVPRLHCSQVCTVQLPTMCYTLCSPDCIVENWALGSSDNRAQGPNSPTNFWVCCPKLSTNRDEIFELLFA